MGEILGRPDPADSAWAAATVGDVGENRNRPDRAASAWAAATVGITVGALAAAAVLAPRSATPGPMLALLVFVGSSVHVASTAWIGTIGEIRDQARTHRARFLWCPLGLVAGAAVTASLLSPHALSRLLLGYFAWQLWHYQRQNLGFVALGARSSGVTGLTGAERRAINAVGLASIASLLCRPASLQLGLRSPFAWAWPIAAIGLGASIVAGLLLLIRRPAPSQSPAFVGLTVMALAFPLPLFLFSSPYAAIGGMTIAHGLQYLLFVGAVTAGSAGRRRRVNAVMAMLVVAVILGATLAASSHLHGGGRAARALYGAYLGVVMTHFVVDAGSWRLRDPIPRRMLSRCLPWLVVGGRCQPAPVDDLPVNEVA